MVSNFFIFTTSQVKPITNILDGCIWGIGLFILLLIHELGHSLSAKKYGVNCKEIGIGLYLIFPILYADLGESWRLKKEKRIIINLSGIYLQLIIGVIIGLIAFLMNSNALRVLFISNFTIALLNLNPFFKLDGYWVVSDLLDTGNLSKAAHDEIKIFLSDKSYKKNVILLIYAFAKMFFLAFAFIWVLTKLFSLTKKMYFSVLLSYSDYFLIAIILFYLFKYIQKWTFNSKNKK